MDVQRCDVRNRPPRPPQTPTANQTKPNNTPENRCVLFTATTAATGSAPLAEAWAQLAAGAEDMEIPAIFASVDASASPDVARRFGLEGAGALPAAVLLRDRKVCHVCFCLVCCVDCVDCVVDCFCLLLPRRPLSFPCLRPLTNRETNELITDHHNTHAHAHTTRTQMYRLPSDLLSTAADGSSPSSSEDVAGAVAAFVEGGWASAEAEAVPPPGASGGKKQQHKKQ